MSTGLDCRRLNVPAQEENCTGLIFADQEEKRVVGAKGDWITLFCDVCRDPYECDCRGGGGFGAGFGHFDKGLVEGFGNYQALTGAPLILCVRNRDLPPYPIKQPSATAKRLAPGD